MPEVASPTFGFGKNWMAFLSVLDDDRIAAAERALQEMLGVGDLRGKRFVDLGSGSGLSSLAARRLGARVHSFDHDEQAVACTRELRHRYFPDDPTWTIEQASVLDTSYLATLGTFDIVYSWGVLHHTGAMWRALENVLSLVGPSGFLFISIYNDQGAISRQWAKLKRLYNCSSAPVRSALVLLLGAYFYGRESLSNMIQGKSPPVPWQFRRRKSPRGMSPWYDVVDWVGGYPFEVAKPEDVFHFCHDRGLSLVNLKTCAGRLGCNEFVFQRHGLASSSLPC